MRPLKAVIFSIIMLILAVSFSQCSNTKALQKKAPTEFGKSYFQRWNAGIKGGGSGLIIYIPIKDGSIQLDSVYFRCKTTKLEVKPNNKTLYIGYFKTGFNIMKQDIIMSSNSKEEYGNQLPKTKEKPPFNLKDNECVVSYKNGNETLYYKIENITEQSTINYPTAPPNKQ